jgi:hypothetical protein
MGTVLGADIPRHEYKDSAFAFGFDVIRGRIRPRVMTPFGRYESGDYMPPLDVDTWLNMGRDKPAIIWARAAEVDLNDPVIQALCGDPDTWRRRHVYAFCKRVQVHPACLLPQEENRPWPRAVIQALELLVQDQNASEFDRDFAFRAQIDEIEKCGIVATNCAPIVELFCAARAWREFMAANDTDEPPKGFTYTGHKVARSFFHATTGKPDDLWPALPGMRATFTELAEANQLDHFLAAQEYTAVQPRRDEIGDALFGPQAARIFRHTIAVSGTKLRTENLGEYFNKMAYVAIAAPEILGPKLHSDSGWKAGKLGFDDVADMALAFVRMEEKIVRLIHAQSAAQDNIKTASLYLHRIDQAFGNDRDMREGIEETVLGAIRNLELMSSKGRLATPRAIERLFPMPERLAITGPEVSPRKDDPSLRQA